MVEKINSKINSYHDLEVWRRAMELVTDIYKVTRTFLKEESYGLRSQLRRAAISVPANIAEGWGRGTTGGYIQFLRNSLIKSLLKYK
ncbi:MAG: four helix bundle protein [Methanophagales archaeon]|nr:four helix bundle protein [Methanophagales archaeon]